MSSTPELTERQSAWGKGASPFRQHWSTADTVALISGFAVSCAWTTGWTQVNRTVRAARYETRVSSSILKRRVVVRQLRTVICWKMGMLMRRVIRVFDASAATREK
jgi:hypothetical protein